MIGDRVVDTRTDLMLLLEGGDETVALLAGGSLHANRVLVVDVHVALRDGRGDGLGDVLREERGVVLTDLRPASQFAQLNAADGGVDVGHAVVEADELVGVALLHALVADHAGLAGHLGIGGGDHAALTGGHVLGRVEREGAEGAEGADVLAVDGGGVGLGTVLEELHTVLVGDDANLVQVGRQTVQVHRQDALGVLGDGRLDGGRVQAEGVGIDVGEDRLGAGEGH